VPMLDSNYGNRFSGNNETTRKEKFISIINSKINRLIDLRRSEDILQEHELDLVTNKLAHREQKWFKSFQHDERHHTPKTAV